MKIDASDQRLAAAAAYQLQQTGLAQNKPAQDTRNAGQAIEGDKVSLKAEISPSKVDTLQRVGNISDMTNRVANELRKTDEGLAAAHAITEKMKHSLDRIIKNFPPYSVEDKERMEHLKQYSSLQKEIISLTLPPPPPPVYEKVKHLWADLKVGPSETIDTPALPQDAPDNQVHAAAKEIQKISGQIDYVRETMSDLVKTG